MAVAYHVTGLQSRDSPAGRLGDGGLTSSQQYGDSSSQFQQALREYCFPQVFNATCPIGSVVFIQTARYGRMKHGRCIASDFHVGCSADVLTNVDQRCSGRQQCDIAVPDNELHDLQPCPKDLFAYLEAAFTCIKGRNAEVPRLRFYPQGQGYRRVDSDVNG